MVTFGIARNVYIYIYVSCNPKRDHVFLGPLWWHFSHFHPFSAIFAIFFGNHENFRIFSEFYENFMIFMKFYGFSCFLTRTHRSQEVARNVYIYVSCNFLWSMGSCQKAWKPIKFHENHEIFIKFAENAEILVISEENRENGWKWVKMAEMSP